MLYGNRSGFIVTDFRINIFDRILIYLFCQCKLLIQLADRFLRDAHFLNLGLIERTVISTCRVFYLHFLLIAKFYFIASCHQIHRLDTRDLGQRDILDILLKCHTVYIRVPYLSPVYALISVLDIRKIHHNLRKRTCACLNPEYFVLLKSCSKHYFGADIITISAACHTHNGYACCQ